MKLFEMIQEKTIIVCPSSVKEKLLTILETYNQLFPVKFYSLEELKKLLFFDYDVSAVLYLMDQYHFEYDVAKMYLENLYYIDEKAYSHEKLDYLVRLKKELDDHHLLTYNPFFLETHKGYPTLVFGYDYLTKFDQKILSFFSYQVVSKDDFSSNIPVYSFDTMEEEIIFVIYQILSLFEKGISLSRISLVNLDSDYQREVLKYFKMFSIPIDICKSSHILSTVMGKESLQYLFETKSFEKTLEYMKTFLDDSSSHLIYQSFLSIFNQYVGLDFSFDVIFSSIQHDLEKISLPNSLLKEKVKVVDLKNSFFDEEDYVFVLGANQGSIPRVFNDEEYLNDSLKEKLGLDSVNVINKYEREATLTSFKSIKNLIVTYKKRYLDSEYYPSNLLMEDVFSFPSIEENDVCYSLQYDSLYLASMLDDFIHYDIKNDSLALYYHSFDIPYRTYDNRFQGISKSDLHSFIQNPLVLSYSTIDTFYKCQFRYYIDHILKLNPYEETFDTLIGSLFHYVLSHVYDKDFDFDRYYSFYLKEKEISSKEKFFLEKLKRELKIVCNFLLEFQHDTGLTNIFTEKNIKIDKSTSIPVVFKGIVDKIMYKEHHGKTLVSIIDYKTGSTDIDLYNAAYGIGMQLLIYLYLISKSDLFSSFSCVGFYLQRILNGEVNIDSSKTYLDMKKEQLKLMGYSTDDVLDLEVFDPTYENSSYIKSLKMTKNGFSSYSKVLDEETMKKFVSYVDLKIDSARDKILDADFQINPKKISDDKEITGCMFCKYQDICHRKNEDIVSLKKHTDFHFLEEGDCDA